MKENIMKRVKEKALFVLNFLIAVIFMVGAVFFLFLSWKLSLIWVGLSIVASPHMKSWLIQKFNLDPRKMLLPKLLVILIGVAASPFIIVSEKQAQQQAKELRQEREAQAKAEGEKQAFLNDRDLYVDKFKELLMQGKYTEVITNAQPYSFDQEIYEIVENAKNLQNEREKELQVTHASEQIKKLIALQKYEEAYNIVDSFQDTEIKGLVEEALKIYVIAEENRLLAIAKSKTDTDFSGLIDIYGQLLKLVPNSSIYKANLILYDNKLRQAERQTTVATPARAVVPTENSTVPSTNKPSVTPTPQSISGNTPKEVDILTKISRVFQGGYTRNQIKTAFDQMMRLYNLPITDEYYEKVGSTLLSLKKSSGIAEMTILRCVIESYTPGVKVQFTEAAAICTTLIENQ